MDTIIKQQENLKAEDKKTGQKRSHFQRTPAFIASVIKAALLHLPAESEASANAGDEGSSLFDTEIISINPPRGGFTDVGKHTGACPKGTSWPVLRSVFEVGLNRVTAHTRAARQAQVHKLWACGSCGMHVTMQNDC